MPNKFKTIFALVVLALIAPSAVYSAPSLLILKNQWGEQSNNVVLGYQGAANKSASVVLSAAQVIALNTTPITLVGSIAASTIEIDHIDLAYSKGSTAFTVSNSASKFLIQYDNSVLAASVLETGFIDQSSSTEADAFGPGAGGAGIVGRAIQITSNGSTGEIAAGVASSVTATVFYNVLN